MSKIAVLLAMASTGCVAIHKSIPELKPYYNEELENLSAHKYDKYKKLQVCEIAPPASAKLSHTIQHNLILSKIAFPNLISKKEYSSKIKYLSNNSKRSYKETIEYNRSFNNRLFTYDEIDTNTIVGIDGKIDINKFDYLSQIPYTFYSVRIFCKYLNATFSVNPNLGGIYSKTLFYDDLFCVAVPKLYYKNDESNSTTTYNLPYLFLGKDFFQCNASKKFLLQMIKSYAKTNDNSSDSCWAIPYVYILSKPRFTSFKNLRFVKTETTGVKLFLKDYNEISYNISVSNEGEISYNPVIDLKYVESEVTESANQKLDEYNFAPSPDVTYKGEKGNEYFFEVTYRADTYRVTYSLGKIEFVKTNTK